MSLVDSEITQHQDIVAHHQTNNPELKQVIETITEMNARLTSVERQLNEMKQAIERLKNAPARLG